MRRALILLATCLLAALLATGASAVPVVQGAPTARDDLQAPIVALVNRARAERGLRPLRVSRPLVRVARAHARAMGKLGFFAHESADGASPSERIRRRYGGAVVGETILWRSPDVSPEGALAMWLTSAPHRRILLGGAFRDVGVAAVHVAGAGGDFGGRDVTIVVADFGRR